MFERVAMCGIAASLLVPPVLSSDETNFADLDTAAAALGVGIPADEISDRIENRSRGDAQGQVNVAALDPVEPSVKLTGAATAVQSPAMAEPFGLDVVRVTSGQVLTKWRGVQAEIRAENEILSRCRSSTELCPAAARDFLAIVAQGQAHTGRARIGMINRAINLSIRPTSDLAQWGVSDRWSAPLVTLTSGRGDCEDFAIAKYVALLQAGVAARDVRLVIMRDLASDLDHAVVAARLAGEWIILDNRWLALVKDSETRRMIPLFVLDQTGVGESAPTPAPAV
jgi:predicted transglutaminase-like cysteine proteinase